MFERFTKSARLVVVDAVREAEQDRAPRVTGEHLMLALLGHGGQVADLLAAAGLTREVLTEEFTTARRRGGLSDADAGALRSLGIDVDAVVGEVERQHGPYALAPRRTARRGHVPFAAEAKALLSGTLREAIELRERRISGEHVLLALAAGDGVVAEVLAGRGLSYPEVRSRLAKAS